MGGAAAVTTMLHVVRRTARASKRSLREYVGFITRDTTTGPYLSLTSGKHRKSRNWTIPALETLETRNFETVNLDPELCREGRYVQHEGPAQFRAYKDDAVR